jgi:DNA-binding IclR family transcriptional regulator
MSTMYRYVALLREVGLLDAFGLNAYRLSARVIALAQAAQQGQTPLETAALPVMTRIRDTFGETALIARRQGDFAYCVDRVESILAVRLQFERGRPMKLHLGSLARVLLAYTPAPERERYLASIAGVIGGKTAEQVSPRALDALAEAGYTESFGEIGEDIWGVAAAIRENGDVIAALGVAAPIYRTDKRKRDKITAAVRAGAAEISRTLGARN